MRKMFYTTSLGQLLLSSLMKRLFLLLWAVTAQAHGAEPILPVKAIAAVVNDYGNSIGCEVHLNKKNIVPYTMDYQDVYVVLYSIDPGCSGGSAMIQAVFAVVGRTDYGRKFYVLPNYSSPHQISIDFPANTYQIFLKDGQIRFRAKALSNSDALCCPSIPVEGRVVFREGMWVNGDKK